MPTNIRGDAEMNGECASWSQQFILLEGLKYIHSLVCLCCISVRDQQQLWSSYPGAQTHKPGSGQLHQEHPYGCMGAGCAVLAGTCCSFTNSQLFNSNGNTCSTANCQAMRKPSPTPCILVVFVKGEIASLGAGRDESCSGFWGVAFRWVSPAAALPFTQGTDSCFLPSQ